MAGAFSSAFSSAFDIGTTAVFSWINYYRLVLRGARAVQKNTAGQKLTVFAFDATTGLPKTGDAANITAYYDLDDAGVTVLTDTSATEKDATNAKGYYVFDLTQGESNGDKILFSGKSATANIVVIAVPAVVYTIPPNFSKTSIDTSGRIDLGKWIGTAPLALSSQQVQAVVPSTQKVDVETIKTNPVVNGGTVTFPTNSTLASTTNITAGTMTTTTNLTNLPSIPNNWLTAAGTAADFGTELATAIWTDTTAGDFTVALSIGKSIMNGVSLGTGLTVARCTLTDTLTTYTGNTPQTGDAYAIVNSGTFGNSALKTLIDAIDDYVDTEVAAIKAKTDQLTFGQTGALNARITWVVDTQLALAGTGGQGYGS